jgi:ABC-type transporter Mla MlaB component
VLTQRPFGSRIALEGAIDDQARLLPVLEQANRQRQLTLDLGGIKFINSIGVREWIKFLAAATKQNIAIALHRVPVVMVHQLNLVPACRGGAIHSFMVPYLCGDCDFETDFELTPSEATTTKPCPDCKKDMTFRDPPAIYLGFLEPSP